MIHMDVGETVPSQHSSMYWEPPGLLHPAMQLQSTQRATGLYMQSSDNVIAPQLPQEQMQPLEGRSI